MSEVSIPVDLYNPGQVFACLGFLEAANTLLADAEGRYDWSDPANPKFLLSGNFQSNPFEEILQQMIGSTISELFPIGWPANVSHAQEIFPSPLSLHVDDKDKPSTTKLPGLLRLTQNDLAMDSWSDGSSRPDFKLYSGNRSGCSISSDMLFGKRDKPKKGKTVGDLANEGIRQLFENDKDAVIRDPLNRLVSMAGSFNLDPRGAWNAMDAGYSPNEHGHTVFASPVVEFMGCFALQNMRPLRLAKGEYCYATWEQSLPGSLARVVCSGAETPYHSRHFQFDLALAGKNKLVTFAEETTQPTP